jgi:hypothetical protein
MQQIADWLQKLGLGQYAQRFAENDITFSILADLTDQDLKEIGVSLGHRRQLLREIANLGKTPAAAASAPALPAQPIAGPTVTPPPSEREAFRREALKRVAAGEPLREIALSFNRRSLDDPSAQVSARRRGLTGAGG